MKLSEHVKAVFQTKDVKPDEIKNLMQDLYKGEVVGMSKKEANDKLRDITKAIFGLDKNSSKRDRKRAYEAHAREFFDIIEEVIDWSVTTGLTDNEWFNILVNYRNLNNGDSNVFYSEATDVILSVSRMGKRHHDTILQRLPYGDSYELETDVYGAAVGAHIDRFIVGLEDWTKLVDAITKAYVELTQSLAYTEIVSATTKLPTTGRSEFIQSGNLSSTTQKKLFNKVCQNVSIANGNAPVVIMGTLAALQELEALPGTLSVQWIADSQKEQVATLGRLGNYGPYTLVEIPQKFVANDVTNRMYSDSILWIFAVGDDKLVDMVDVGETIIDEITERGEANGRLDDVMKYEVQREIGVAARVSRWFGQWTVTA